MKWSVLLYTRASLRPQYDALRATAAVRRMLRATDVLEFNCCHESVARDQLTRKRAHVIKRRVVQYVSRVDLIIMSRDPTLPYHITVVSSATFVWPPLYWHYYATTGIFSEDSFLHYLGYGRSTTGLPGIGTGADTSWYQLW